MLVVFALLFAACALFVEDFFSWVNVERVWRWLCRRSAWSDARCCSAWRRGISICQSARLWPARESVAAVVTNAVGSVLLGMLTGVLVGGAVGLCNGVVISRFRINALIATLAMMQVVRGLGFIISGGRAVGVTNSGFFALGTSSLLGVPTPVWIALVCFVVFGLLLQRTTFGRNTLAIGGNKEAARLSGIPVARLKTIIFSVQGLMAGFAGVVLASRMTSGQPKPPEMFELQVISACVLGGVSLTGGVGSIGCVIAGVLIMGVVENALNLLNVPTFYQNVVRGIILLAAVMLDQLKNRVR